MGIKQTNNLLHLTLDQWNDQVFLNGTAYPAGYFACEAMNISLDELPQLREISEQISIHAERVYDPLSERRDFFLRYIGAMLTIPYGLYHFLCGSLPLENDYLRRLKRRDETHFSVAAHDYFNSELYRQEMQVYHSVPLEPFTESGI
ncbi:MAG: hypothetical protein IJ617_03770 [Oscillospiraceae bacterium]|nr:hypothetical protein [Oscillospiraceae bacterium]